MRSAPAVTIGERVLVHLSAFSRFADAFECPADTTQEGIARGLGISRAHAALELKRLRQGGFVLERIAHVTAGKMRRKVYFVTRTGEERARAMRDFAKQKPLVVVDGDRRREALGAEVVQTLRRLGLREVEAYQRVLVADVVDLAAAKTQETARPPTAPPFLGRERELGAIRGWMGRPEAPVLAVLGVAGIGKTVLAERAAATADVPAFVRRAYAFETARTFAHAMAGFLAAHGRPRLRNHIASGAFDPVVLGAILAQDLRGVLIAVDDADRSAEVCAFLEMAAEAAPAAKLLLTARTRPAAYDTRDLAEGRAAELVLEGLDRASAAALAVRLGLPADPASVDRAMALTRGHPLAIALLASTGLRTAERTRRFLDDAVMTGIDERALPALRSLAVLRRPVPDPEGLRIPAGILRTLTRRGLLAEHPDGFSLHDLARDVLLARASVDEASAAHTRAAAYWARRADPLESAHHAVEANRIDDALASLAPVAMNLAESPRAAELVSLLLRLPEDRRPALPVARALEFLGRWEEAKPRYAAIAAESGAGVAEALLGLGRIASKEGRYADAERHLRGQLDATRGNERGQGPAERLLSVVLRRRGAYAEAHRFIDRALEHVAGDPQERTRALIDRAALLYAEGRHADALVCIDTIGPVENLPAREAAALENNRAVNLARLGRRAEAVDAFGRSAARSREAGDLRGAAYAMANAADALVELGQLDEARAALDAASLDAGGGGDRILGSMIEANLGKMLARLGDRSAAEARMLRSVALLESVENPLSLRERCEELARFYADVGDDRAAREWRARADLARGSPPGFP